MFLTGVIKRCNLIAEHTDVVVIGKFAFNRTAMDERNGDGSYGTRPQHQLFLFVFRLQGNIQQRFRVNIQNCFLVCLQVG